MPTQSEKRKLFRSLHLRDYAFIIPNPWEVGTARRILAHLGFEALATTSMGFIFSIGKRGYHVDKRRRGCPLLIADHSCEFRGCLIQ